MSKTTQPATILVIDDDAMVRLLAGESLEEAGYRVLQADSAEAGLEVFEDAAADLVLLDVMMPGMNGFAACARLRAHPAGHDVPVIVMTGLDDRASILAAYEAGATDFMTKPIVWDLLPYRVRYSLRASQTLRDAVRNEALLATSQRIASMGSWEWLKGRNTVSCSDELLRIHGMAAGRTEQDDALLLNQVHEDDRDAVERALDRARRLGAPYTIDFRLRRPDGSVRHLREQTDVERDSALGVLAVRGVRHDITEKIEAAKTIHSLAFVDGLTGLPNHAQFGETVKRWLPYATRRKLRCAIARIRLERFQTINDTLGSTVGDRVLKMASERLLRCVRAEDPKGVLDGQTEPGALARLGANEFAILLLDIRTPEQALSTVQRMCDALLEPLLLEGGQELTLSVNVGLALTPDDGVDVDTLMRNASTAMHAAREPGQRPIRLYNQAMSEAMKQRHLLEVELRKALELRQLRVHYQAKVDARTARVVGAEALVRWEHPQRGWISPADFIPIAEETGLIVPLTDAVLQQVCLQLAAWQGAGHRVTPISVNVDGASLQSEGFAERARCAMARNFIEARHLEFEITESALMKDLDHSAQVLCELKRLGVKLAIDDFGTGYSSLTYLKRFPLDTLKIDRSFIENVPNDANDAALTDAVIAMGRGLRLELVAEGVEKPEQARYLLRQGCPVMQGNLFSRPLPPDDFANFSPAMSAEPAAAEWPH